jgi:serine/threonine-protein kinase RsbW|tara:strand:- start:359 stop:769 length:411 start_codon:yes stop_codon:yes gene_type:complete
MTFEEHKEFPVESSSLKQIRNFAREVLAKDNMFDATKDDIVLALAEAAQNVVKHAYNGKPTGDTMRVEISFKDNQLIIEIYDKGKPVIPENIKPRKIDDIKPGGLGTFFIGQIMDEVIFKTSRNDWVNHLILTKNY